MSALEIVDAVAARRGVTRKDLFGPSRYVGIVRARQEAMWRVRIHTRMSLPEIGELFGGRHHTTVIHGVEAHEDRMPIRGRA